MSMGNYLNQYKEQFFDADTEWLYNYPMASPRVIEKIISYSPYIDKNTKTWWIYSDEQGKYIDSEIVVNIDQAIFNEALKKEKVSVLINDANYATSDEDEPMSIIEVDNILT